MRQLAKNLGVDLALVEASGVTGVIRRDDVERFAARLAPATEAPVPQSGAPLADGRHAHVRARDPHADSRSAQGDGRRDGAQRLHGAARDVLSRSRRHRDDAADRPGLRADPRLAEHRIGLLAVAAKAVCLALRAEPSLGSSWDDEAGEIVTHHYVNLGIAAATERGLIVPNIPDAEQLTLPQLADAIRDLAAMARAGRATPASLTDGTFSITNFGVFGVDAGTPILNPPEAGILGLGTVRRRPWEFEGESAPRHRDPQPVVRPSAGRRRTGRAFSRRGRRRTARAGTGDAARLTDAGGAGVCPRSDANRAPRTRPGAALSRR